MENYAIKRIHKIRLRKMTDGGPHILSINGGQGAWHPGTVSGWARACHSPPPA